jgi:cytochrome c-type biogenesis protein CcmH
MLALLLAVIVFAALLPILLPLSRARIEGPEAGSFDRVVYRDQLRELDRDLTRGVLSASEAASARLEIQRRLLATSARKQSSARTGASPIVAVAVALVVAVGSVGLYAWIGAPAVPDMPFASRTIDTNGIQVAQGLARLKQRAEAEPANAEAWLLYARAAADGDRWVPAAEAYKRAIDLGQNDAATLAAYGEMLTLGGGGTIGPAARAAFTAAIAKNPKHEAARYYNATILAQEGEAVKAIAMLQSLLTDLPANARERADIGKRIAEFAKAAGIAAPPLATGQSAAPGPDAATMEAASQLPADRQQAMISGMVGKLAARLETEPNDLDGWMRLGRAYAALGDTGKAADAYRRATALKPGDAGILQQAAQALLGNQPGTAPVPAEAIEVLRQIEALTSGQPAVLWYLGLAAAQSGRPGEARTYWRRLLANLPPDGEEAKTLKSAIEALRDK